MVEWYPKYKSHKGQGNEIKLAIKVAKCVYYFNKMLPSKNGLLWIVLVTRCKDNNKITELRIILQRESQNS